MFSTHCPALGSHGSNYSWSSSKMRSQCFSLLLPSPGSAPGGCAWLSVQIDFVPWDRTLDNFKSFMFCYSELREVCFASPSQGHSWPPGNQHKLEGFYKAAKFSEQPFLSSPALPGQNSTVAWGQTPRRLKTERVLQSEEVWSTKPAPFICCLWSTAHSEPNTASCCGNSPQQWGRKLTFPLPSQLQAVFSSIHSVTYYLVLSLPWEANRGINNKFTVKRKPLTQHAQKTPQLREIQPFLSGSSTESLPQAAQGGTSMEPVLRLCLVSPNQPRNCSSATLPCPCSNLWHISIHPPVIPS